MRILQFLFSTKLFGTLMLVFALTMAAGTFIENDYSTETARAIVYNAKWFEILLIVLAANFIGNIPKYGLFSWTKLPVLVFHLAFVVIILGAGITRYRGQEGMLSVKEGEENNVLVSYNSYLEVALGNGHFYKNFSPEPLQLSEIGPHFFNEKFSFEDEVIRVKIKDFTPRASYRVLKAKENRGKTYLQTVFSLNGRRVDCFIEKGEYRIVDGISISFENNQPAIIRVYDSLGIKIKIDANATFLKMKNRKRGIIYRGRPTDLLYKSIYEVKEKKIVFAELHKNVVLKTVSSEKNSENTGKESAIWVEVSNGKISRCVPLMGGNGHINAATEILLGKTFVRLSYGSIYIPLPFSVYLRDFEMERYPGSESPASFASEIEIRDNTDRTPYRIFMNNVLDYKGYRLFQSAYFPDETGTILAVNNDFWGTMTTYVGYLLMGLGMVMSLFWRDTFFKSSINQRS